MQVALPNEPKKLALHAHTAEPAADCDPAEHAWQGGSPLTPKKLALHVQIEELAADCDPAEQAWQTPAEANALTPQGVQAAPPPSRAAPEAQHSPMLQDTLQDAARATDTRPEAQGVHGGTPPVPEVPAVQAIIEVHAAVKPDLC